MCETTRGRWTLSVRASLALVALAAVAVVRVRAEPESLTPSRVRAAVEKAIAPLQKSLVVYAEKRDCFSCHHQAVPLVALEIARSRGLAIDEDAFQGAVALTLADLESALETYRKGADSPAGSPARPMPSGRSKPAAIPPTRSPPR